MRGFVFSLDAFIAFTLVLIAVYSLIFFSSVPSAYYYLLTQGHFLARDALMATAMTECDPAHYSCGGVSGSILDAVVSLGDNPTMQDALIRESIGEIIPNQFGYTLEISENQGESWITVYDTGDPENSGDPHAKKINKMKVTSQVVNFGYTGVYQKLGESPFSYNTCSGTSGGLVITCGNYSTIDPDAYGDVVPLPVTKLVRITVYI